MDTNSYFALTVRLTEPDQPMTVEIEGDLDIATIPFLEGILIAAEHVEPEEVVIDISGLGFVGVVGVRALTEEAERLEMRGRRTRVIGASTTVKRLIALTGGFDWLRAGHSTMARQNNPTTSRRASRGWWPAPSIPSSPGHGA